MKIELTVVFWTLAKFDVRIILYNFGLYGKNGWLHPSKKGTSNFIPKVFDDGSAFGLSLKRIHETKAFG